jgi:hypothetical protein
MSAKVTTRMQGDVMVVTVKGAADAREARHLAQQAAGTAAVGSAVPHPDGGKHTVHVSAKALAARKVVGKVPSAKALAPEAPNLDTILASLDPAVAAAIRAVVANPRAGVPTAKAPSTFVQDVIAPRAARKAAASCTTCQDYGVVRGAGKRRGDAYSTANGARGALAPMTCPTCKGKHTEALSA